MSDKSLKVENCDGPGRKRFVDIAPVALRELDDKSLNSLAFTIEAHIEYRRRHGHSAMPGAEVRRDLRLIKGAKASA